MCRIHGIVYDTLMEDEENQIRGYVHFNDGAGVGFSHLTLFTPREAVRIVKNGEVTHNRNVDIKKTNKILYHDRIHCYKFIDFIKKYLTYILFHVITK